MLKKELLCIQEIHKLLMSHSRLIFHFFYLLHLTNTEERNFIKYQQSQL